MGDAWIAVGVFFAVSMVVGLVAFGASDGPGLDGAWLPIAIAVPPLFQIGYVAWAARTKGGGRRDFGVGFRPSDLAIGVGLFVVGVFLAGFAAAAVEWLFDVTPDASVAEIIEDSDEEGGGVSGWIILMAVLGATVIPVIEEVVYRGLWWSALEKRGMREEWVLVTTSALFAAIHLEPVRFPLLFVLALAFGYGRIRTGRIGPSVVAHVCVNTMGMIVLVNSLS